MHLMSPSSWLLEVVGT